MEHRQINENYQRIAEDLIQNEPELAYIKDSRVRIAYLESDQAKKADADKLVLGECEKVQAKNKWALTTLQKLTVVIPLLLLPCFYSLFWK